MPSPQAPAPLALFRDPTLTAAAKLLWVAKRSNKSIQLARPTIRRCLAQLQAAGWYDPTQGPIDCDPAGPRVSFPLALLAEPRAGAQAKILWGLLQHWDRYGEFTMNALSTYAQLSIPTVRRAVQELARTGWLEAGQTNQRAPIGYDLRDHDQDRRDEEATKAAERIHRAENKGETIMKEYLSLLFDTTQHLDNAKHDFLVNPITGERLELDRYYFTARLAFEYQGAQHFRTTARFPSEDELIRLQVRDLIKAARCQQASVTLIPITDDDLTLEAMLRRAGNPPLPRNNLVEHEELIQWLEKRSKHYRSNT